jgi:hypothetical protein
VNNHVGATTVGESGAVPPARGSRSSSISEAERAGHHQITSIERPPPVDPLRGAVEFAAAEAVRRAEAGASVHAGAHDVLRWASRRRTVIELAVVQVAGDDALPQPIREAATAILQRALVVGLLF